MHPYETQLRNGVDLDADARGALYELLVRDQRGLDDQALLDHHGRSADTTSSSSPPVLCPSSNLIGAVLRGISESSFGVVA